MAVQDADIRTEVCDCPPRQYETCPVCRSVTAVSPSAALPPGDAYVPVPLRQRHLLAGDVFVGQGGQLWTVAVGTRPGYLTATIGQTVRAAEVDPDQVFNVLVEVPMAQAVSVAREQLAMQLVERNNGGRAA